MTKAQEFMTAVEDDNIYHRYSVIALRKENNILKEELEDCKKDLQKIRIEFELYRR